MKSTAKHLSILLILLTTVFSSSCDMFSYKQDSFSGGTILNDAMMSEIKAEIFGDSLEYNEEENEAASSDGSSNTEESTNPDNIRLTVYWTEGGGVWHLFEDCGHLKRAKEIFSGSVQDAIQSGKEKICSSCNKKSN